MNPNNAQWVQKPMNSPSCYHTLQSSYQSQGMVPIFAPVPVHESPRIFQLGQPIPFHPENLPVNKSVNKSATYSQMSNCAN